ncbi:MAG: hypothetical protein MJZ35_09575, partial [Bacteroidaceae bacterium]|nr:hypothetical protein [Bacteroidaceae bacterium]
MKRILSLALTACSFLGLNAQKPTISPLPQKAVWGETAFARNTPFTLVGAADADKDAVDLLRNNLTLQASAKEVQGVRLTIGEAGDKA